MCQSLHVFVSLEKYLDIREMILPHLTFMMDLIMNLINRREGNIILYIPEVPKNYSSNCPKRGCSDVVEEYTQNRPVISLSRWQSFHVLKISFE